MHSIEEYIKLHQLNIHHVVVMLLCSVPKQKFHMVPGIKRVRRPEKQRTVHVCCCAQ